MILPYISSYLAAEEPAAGREPGTRYADAPQLLVPNPAGIAFTRLLGRSTRFRRTEGPYAVAESVPVLGRWLTFFADRAEHPASSLMLAVTDALAAHWATGQSPVEDLNLGALLGWIDPPPGMSGAQAAAPAEDPLRCPSAGPATDPTFDNEILEQRIIAVRTARFTGDGRAYDRAKAALTDALATQLRPTWALMWRAVDLLRGLPEGGHVRARWDADKAAFTWHARHVRDGGPPQPRRDGAVSAARRLANLERVQQMVAAQRAFDDPLVMAEHRMAGEAFAGLVAAAEPDRVDASGKRRVLRPRITVDTADEVLAGAGAVLTSPARPSQKARVIDVTAAGRRTRVVLELQGGMGRSLTPGARQRPRGRRVRVLRRLHDGFQPAPAFPDPEDTPWTHGGPPPPYVPSDEDAGRTGHDRRRRTRRAGHRADPGRPGRRPPRRRGRLPARCRQVDAGRPRCRRSSPTPARTSWSSPQTNEQVDDLTDRLAAARPRLPVGRLAASDYIPLGAGSAAPEASRSPPSCADLAGCPRGAQHGAQMGHGQTDATWPWAIVDEAYQMRSDLLLRVAGRFDRALFVGDPGQLDPFSAVQTDRWTGLTWDPMQSAVAVLLRHNPDVPVHALPVSWRLPASAAPVVAEAFYPFTGFRAATGREQRRVEFSTCSFGKNALDLAVETAATSGWALYELPARHTVRTDAEAVAACAALAARLLQRGALSYSERAVAGAPVTPARIAVGTAHRDQAQAIRRGPAGQRPARHHRRHRQPPAGPRVRRRDRAAPAVRPPRRHRVPPGGRPPVRAHHQAPPRLHRRRPGRHPRTARRPPLHRTRPPERPRQVPRRLGGQPVPPGSPAALEGTSPMTGRAGPAKRKTRPTKSRVVCELESTSSSAFRHGGCRRGSLPEQGAEVNVPAACRRTQRLCGLTAICEPGDDDLPHELADVRRVALAVERPCEDGAAWDPGKRRTVRAGCAMKPPARNSGASPSLRPPEGNEAAAVAAEQAASASKPLTTAQPQCGRRSMEAEGLLCCSKCNARRRHRLPGHDGSARMAEVTHHARRVDHLLDRRARMEGLPAPDHGDGGVCSGPMRRAHRRPLRWFLTRDVSIGLTSYP